MKNYRKIIISILVAVMMLSLSLTMYADDVSVSVTPTVGSLTSGAKVTLAVRASENVYGATADLVYNEKVLKLVEISSDVSSFKGTITREGKRVTYWYNDEDVSSSKMFTLHFELQSEVYNVDELSVIISNIEATSLNYATLTPSDVVWKQTICRNHVWQTVSETKATCTTDGVKKSKCANCTETKSEIVELKLGHDYKQTVVEPDCTNQGYTNNECSRCDSVYKSEMKDPLGHKYDKVGSTTTCSKLGQTSYKCSVCETQYQENDSQLLDHKYNVSTTPSTCITLGKDVNTCKDCGYSYETQHKELAGHDYKGQVTEPTCTEAGNTLFTCSVCSHSYIDDITSAKGHIFGEWKTEIAATTERDGIAKRKCTGCDLSETQKLPKLFGSETEPGGSDSEDSSSQSWMIILIIILIIGIVVLSVLLIATYLTFQKKREARKKV